MLRCSSTLCRWPAFTASLTFELFRRNLDHDTDPAQREQTAPSTSTSTERHGYGYGLVDHEQDHVDPMAPPLNQGMLQSVLGSARFGRGAKKGDEGEYCAFYSLFFFCCVLVLIRFVRTVVRARYQNRNLILPMCADEDKHMRGSPEFCTLRAFRERVDELAPRDWEAECAVR